MRRRRKGRRLVWFPTLGAQVGAEGETTRIAGFTWSINLLKEDEPNTGGFEVVSTPLIPDLSQSFIEKSQDEGAFVTLADTQQRAYRIRRVVGKIHAAMAPQVEGNDPPAAAILGAGLIVLAVNEDDAPMNPDDAAYNPLLRENITDPWIWRRTWILGTDGNSTQLDEAVAAFTQFPRSNQWDTGAFGGSCMDAKTNRIVGPEERLFLVLASHRLPLHADSLTDGIIAGFFDYRLLGSLFTATNRGNASR